MPERVLDWDSNWFQGVQSSMDPSQVPLGYAWSVENMLNLGGLWSCRPGHRCIKLLPDGNLQGAAIFRPQVGIEQIVVAIDGLLYAAAYPFYEGWRQLPGIQLSASAKQIFWALAVQSAERLSLDIAAGIKVIEPKVVLFAQDGLLTAPAWYDGSNSGHVRGDPFGTPSGGPMVWVGDRLWVAAGNQVYASDVANPFSFREQIYLGGATSFFFADEVTAMQKTPSIESPQLMVFTGDNASLLQANIRDRSQWPTTVDFQVEVVQVGCLSQKSVVSHYGHIIWFSPSGVAIYDPATSGKLTSRLPVRDSEMMVSKIGLSDDLSLVCAATFGQYMLMSVPHEDVHNKHTWVLNNASLASLNDDSGPCWSGHWTGTRPVEWLFGEIASQERIYHVAADTDGHNHLWESFTPDRLDGGCPIAWKIETRGYFGQTAAIQSKPPGERVRLLYVDVALAGISENLDLGVFFAGGTRGAFRQLMDRRLNVSKGSLSYTLKLDANTQIFAFKPQSRNERTQDANQIDNAEDGSCPVERFDLDNIDDSFQLAICGHGPATIRWIRPWGLTVPPNVDGNGMACEDEVTLKAVRFDGWGAHGDTLQELVDTLTAAPMFFFESNETASLSIDDFIAIGTGYAQSVISQRAADRVAKIIATNQAEMELASVRPPTLSTGLGFE
jgi:hypothetical protein